MKLPIFVVVVSLAFSASEAFFPSLIDYIAEFADYYDSWDSESQEGNQTSPSGGMNDEMPGGYVKNFEVVCDNCNIHIKCTNCHVDRDYGMMQGMIESTTSGSNPTQGGQTSSSRPLVPMPQQSTEAPKTSSSEPLAPMNQQTTEASKPIPDTSTNPPTAETSSSQPVILQESTPEASEASEGNPANLVEATASPVVVENPTDE
uniref:Putative conserved secreted protein n=1 Tax=Lutzomyia longipalpis TaxID=7200 RepID=A0A1B0CDH8_LUTLO